MRSLGKQALCQQLAGVSSYRRGVCWDAWNRWAEGGAGGAGGRAGGRAAASLRDEAVLQTLTLDVLKSSEIKGRSSTKARYGHLFPKQLGMDTGGLAPADRNIEGVVEMMLDATEALANL